MTVTFMSLSFHQRALPGPGRAAAGSGQAQVGLAALEGEQVAPPL
jgi:hypothetical protein